MEVRNCRRCGRLYNHVAGQHICPKCKEEAENKFLEVKEYIRENKVTGVPEVAEACDVDVRQIHQWIREERLEFSPDSPVGIDCEICGAMIRTGRFCEKCKTDMAKELGNSIKKPEVKRPEPRKDMRDNPKMRFLNE